MTTTSACPLCDKKLNIPDGGDGRRVRCPGCSEYLLIQGEGRGQTLVGLCDACGAEREPDDTFCPGCGADLVGGDAADEQPPPPPPRRRSSYAERAHGRKVRRASAWVLGVAVLFALFGTVFGLSNRKDAQEALANIASYDADEALVMEDGTELTAGELRDLIDSEVLFVFVINYGLAIMMLACWFWSRRSPLPALVTALGIYLTVIVVDGVVDPSSMLEGLLVKILVIVALSNGVRAALAQRAADSNR